MKPVYLVLIVVSLVLAGCGAIASVLEGGSYTAGDAVVEYVGDFCAPSVGAEERVEILAELNDALAPHRLAIDCAAALPPT